MNAFDEYIFDNISQEDIPMPKTYHTQIENTLNTLSETTKTSPVIPFRRILSTAAAFVFVFLMMLPNVSPAYAQTVEGVPVLGKLVQVFTIRNYFHTDETHELNVVVPGVQVPDAPEAQEQINADVEALVNATVDQFYRDMEANGISPSAVYLTHEVITNTDSWFTLQLSVEEVQASGNVRLYLYHIDRTTGNYVTFGDLFTREGVDAIRQELLSQIEKDENMEPESMELLSDRQNFRFLENGDLVILYDEATIAPAYMGNPSFTIPASVFSSFRK